MKKFSIFLIIAIVLTFVQIPVSAENEFFYYNINTIAAGESHSLGITETHDLYAFGYNYYGQIGNGTNENVKKPVKIMSDVIFTDAGDYNSFAITSDGTLYGWGDNQYGQILDSDKFIYTAPVKVMTNVKFVSAGYDHTLIIKKDGSLWGFGSNKFGQLGIKANDYINGPVKIMASVKTCSAGNGFSLVTSTSNELFVFGINKNGQIGKSKDVKTVEKPEKLLDNVGNVSAGYNHSIIVKTDGSVFTSGNNEFGQLGSGTKDASFEFININLGDIVQVFAGKNYSAAIDKSGIISTWGHNCYGQLHSGTRDDKSVPLRIATDAVSFAAGGYHSLFLKSEKALSSAGLGTSGQLGYEISASSIEPYNISGTYEAIAAGNNHVAAVDSSGKLYTWGNNADGQLGDGTYTVRTSPVWVKVNNNAIINVWAGGNTTLVKTLNNEYFIFGSNNFGQLGTKTTDENSNIPVEITSLRGLDITKASVSDNHILVIINGNVYAWGCNESYQLGDRTNKSKSYPVLVLIGEYDFVDVKAGNNFSLALDKNGNVYSWGLNTSKQLGIEPDKLFIDTPTIISGLSKIKSIAAGYNHAAAVDETGVLYTWGSNDSGQLITEANNAINKTEMKAADVFAGNKFTAYINNKRLFIWGEFGELFGAVSANTETAVFGDEFCVYTDSSKKLYTVGNNNYGQLGNSSSALKVIPRFCMLECLTEKINITTSLSLSKTKSTLTLNSTLQLKATLKPSSAPCKIITWNSSDENIASVKDGLVSAVGYGTAVITASAADGRTAQCTVTVPAKAVGISLNTSKVTLSIKDTYKLIALPNPVQADVSKIAWKSSNSKVAKVTTKGTVTAVSYGTATITATSATESFTASCTVNVVPKTPSSINASATSYNSITVKWSKVTDIDGYEIAVFNTETQKYKVIADIPSKTSYIHKSLISGQTYVYKVRTYKLLNGVKIYSELSNSANAVPVLNTIKSITITADKKSAVLRWSAVKDVTGYEIYMSTSKNGKYNLISTEKNIARSYTASGLTTGKTYYFKVRTIKKEGEINLYGDYCPVSSIVVK